MSSAVVLLSGALAGNVKQIPHPDTVSPGFAGFVVVFLIAAATVLLIRSMVGHLRKVRYSPEPPDNVPAGSGPSDSAGAARSSGGGAARGGAGGSSGDGPAGAGGSGPA